MGGIKGLLFILMLFSGIKSYAQQRPLYKETLYESVQQKKPQVLREQIKSRLKYSKSSLNYQPVFYQLPQKISTEPLDTCATHTYRLKIGDNNTNEVATEITHLASGEMLVTGETDKNGSNDALLIKLDKSGNIEWMKTYGNSTTQEIFYKARPTLDGGIIAIGSSFSAGYTSGFIMICKMDANGNLQWTRKYQPVSNTYSRGADIIQLADNDFAFLGDDGANLIYGKLSFSGTLLWDQRCQLTGSIRALNIVEDYDGWIIASTGMQGRWHVSSVIKVDTSNGSFIWQKNFGGSSVNEQFIFNKMVFVNLKPRITGIWSFQGGPYYFMRLTMNTLGTVETHEQYYTQTNPDTTSSLVLTPWAEGLAYCTDNHSNSVSIFENQPDVNLIPWSNTYSNTIVTNVAGIEKCGDAGFITVCTESEASGSDILLIKVDSAGRALGCDGATTNVTSSYIGSSVQDTVFTPTTVSLEEDNTLPTSNSLQLDTTYACRQLTCPVRMPEDTCLQSFRKYYRSYEFSDVATGFTVTDDDHLIVSGIGRTDPYDPTTDAGFVMKTDNRGNIVAELKMLIGIHCDIARQIRLADGNFLVLGTFMEPGNTVSGVFLSKFDNNLNNIWVKIYDITLSSYNLDDIIEAADGSLIMSIVKYDFLNLADHIVLVKFDNTGNIISQKEFGLASGFDLLSGYGTMTSIGSSIYLAEDILNASGSNFNLFLTKFDATSLQVQWGKTYTYTGGSLDMRWIIKMNNNELVANGSVQLPTTEHTTLVKLDGAGNIMKQAAYNHLPSNFPMTHAANNDLVFSGYTWDSITSQFVTSFQRLDSNLQIKISKKNTTWLAFSVRNSEEDSQGYIYATGSNYYQNAYNADFSITKYTPDGLTGSCPSDTLPVQKQPINLVVNNLAMTSAAISAIVPSGTMATFTNSSLQQNALVCSKQNGCDTIWITGSHTLCDTSMAYDFIANKNTGCTAPVNWVLPSSGIIVKLINDSLLRIKFLKDSSYDIKAEILTGCKTYMDSTQVAVKAVFSLNLGPDTTICPGNKILLNANPGYVSYKWQDGSTDSTFTVSNPGTYFVIVTDACGNTRSDTVNVAIHPPIPFDLGPNISICEKDTSALTAPLGFIHYQWNSYNIKPDTGQQVKVFPDTTFMYKVTAEQSSGCYVTDSLLVTVKKLPIVHLGNDTSFCAGQSIVLDAGNGNENYLWSTGALSQSIVVSQQGIYWVKATLNGCSSSDTLDVLNVYPLPVFSLGDDTALCEGQQLQYNFNLPRATYLWNSGSTSGSGIISSPGVYWLQVTQMGCSDRDTINVNYNPTPVVNLGNDTALCEGHTLQLNIFYQGANYLWQDGSNASSFLVSNPGTYWVITTFGNCKSSDTINVSYLSAPYFTLGKDTLICTGQQYILKPLLNTEASFLWQNGSTNSSYTVLNSGTYFLTATNDCGSYTDSIVISTFYCEPMMPSAFTPNGDGRNEVFRVKYPFPVKQFDLSVYDRWGEKVFETNNIKGGWDGNWKGQPAMQGAYIWVIIYTDMDNKKQQLKGLVTLLR